MVKGESFISPFLITSEGGKTLIFRATVFVILSVILLTYSITYALDFVVKPIRIYVFPQKTTAVFEIQSLTDKKIAVEAEVRKWDQDPEGNDILVPTEDVVVVPPYIELEGRQKQLVRLAYLGNFSRPQEFYRLLLRQVPRKIKPEKNPKKVKPYIQILLNLSIPVFVNSKSDINYSLNFEPKEKSKEKVSLTIKNDGNAFAKIVHVSLFKGEKEIFSKNMVKYVLPKKEILFELKKTKVGVNGKITTEPFEDIPDKMVIVLEDAKEITIEL